MLTAIKEVRAREVITLRGHPGIEATVITESGHTGSAVCTAGTSVGSHEIVFEYDEDPARFMGKGVSKAVSLINEKVSKLLIGVDSANQSLCDNILLSYLDENGKALGGNITGAISAAVLKAGAESLGIPLYRHIGGNSAVTLPAAAYGAIGGGKRFCFDSRSGSKPSYSFIAYDFPTFADAMDALWNVHDHFCNVMESRFGLRPTKGGKDRTADGFFSVCEGMVSRESELWDIMANSISACGYDNRVGLQVDLASDCYFDHENKVYRGLFDNKIRTYEEFYQEIIKMVRDYPFVILEDPLNEDDYEGHARLTKDLDIQIVGDDLFTTNTERVTKGIKKGAANTVLLKVNQIGTISQSLEMIQLAYENGYGIMPCGSRGEGLSIVDYCVGVNATCVRESCLGFGGTRFLEIEKELGSSARFLGRQSLKGRRFQ